MWRLRAETAAARAGDFQAVRALAAAATLVEAPPSPEAAAHLQHLQTRLVGLLVRRAHAVSKRMDWLRSASCGGAAPQRLDVRR